ncbi:hypothetical protein C1H46_030312 [Malus baccata]|uniref:Uncharacterized protein n=1 Tax=Malus baccata TaxID=106549 RepID=A0A540LD66_MALBA|nr:hypothetical protein C1H46_030312 [Malus baccata]
MGLTEGKPNPENMKLLDCRPSPSPTFEPIAHATQSHLLNFLSLSCFVPLFLALSFERRTKEEDGDEEEEGRRKKWRGTK